MVHLQAISVEGQESVVTDYILKVSSAMKNKRKYDKIVAKCK